MLPGELRRATDGSAAARCEDAAALDAVVPGGRGAVVLWSGSLGSADVDEGDPRNWGPGAWDALDAAVQRWVDAGRGADLIVRTHAAHIVSDAPSALRFAKAWAGQGVRIAYDLASMFTPETVRGAIGTDLLARRLDALGNPELSRGIAFVLISNARTHGRRVVPSPVDQGELDPAQLRAAAQICASFGIAVAVLDADRGTDLRPSGAAAAPYTLPRVDCARTT